MWLVEVELFLNYCCYHVCTMFVRLYRAGRNDYVGKKLCTSSQNGVNADFWKETAKSICSSEVLEK